MLIVRDIAAAAEATDWLLIEDFRRITYVRGTRNAHLADADGYDSEPPSAPERLKPLPLDAEVHGDFLTLEYCGHGPWAILTDHDTLQAVESAILGGAGILNTFTEFVLTFIGGKQRSYEVRDASGNLLAKDGVRVCPVHTAHAVDRASCRFFWNDGKPATGSEPDLG